jgi:hypothetical protein
MHPIRRSRAYQRSTAYLDGGDPDEQHGSSADAEHEDEALEEDEELHGLDVVVEVLGDVDLADEVRDG